MRTRESGRVWLEIGRAVPVPTALALGARGMEALTCGRDAPPPLSNTEEKEEEKKKDGNSDVSPVSLGSLKWPCNHEAQGATRGSGRTLAAAAGRMDGRVVY